MPVLESPSLGPLEYRDEDVIRFPLGLPGFEQESLFLLVSRPEDAPVVCLQSVQTPGLFFLAISVELLDGTYELQLLDEYRLALGLMNSNAQPGSSLDLSCLALLCIPEGGGVPTANLAGPIVIHRENRLGVQAIREDARYATQHGLFS